MAPPKKQQQPDNGVITKKGSVVPSASASKAHPVIKNKTTEKQTVIIENKIKKPVKSQGVKAKAKDKLLVLKSSQNKGKKTGVAKGTSQKAKRVRQAAFLKAMAQQDVRFNITVACQKAGISRRGFEKWRAEDPRFAEQYEEVTEAQLDKWEECLFKNILAGDTASVIFALKTKGRRRGWIEKDHPTDAKVNAILDEWTAGTLTALEAGVKIYKMGCALPKVLELQLSKNEPIKPPGDGDEKAPSIEEIERRAEEAFKSVQEQKDTFLPNRQIEVAELKQQMKDQESFGPGGENARNGEE